MVIVKDKDNKDQTVKETAKETAKVAPAQDQSADEAEVDINPVEKGQPTTLKEVETHFDELSDLTDLVAQVNSIYESDIEGNMQKMEDFIHNAMKWDVNILEPDAKLFYISHMSFHREIVSEVIADARQVLIDERRPYVKRLVNYFKEFKRWLANLEKEFAA